MQGELNSLHNAMKGREGNFRLRAAAQLHIFSDWSQERSRDTVAALHEPAQVPHSARACHSMLPMPAAFSFVWGVADECDGETENRKPDAHDSPPFAALVCT